VLSFHEEELKLAQRIGSWNAAVTGSFLLSAVFLGVLIGAVIARSSLWAISALGVFSAISLTIAFALTRHVARKVQAASAKGAAKSRETDT